MVKDCYALLINHHQFFIETIHYSIQNVKKKKSQFYIIIQVITPTSINQT